MPTSFLDLPPELRNEIYALALPSDDYIDISLTYNVLGREMAPAPHIGLLFVNRQINAEATPIFYANNTFEMQDIATTKAFLRQLKPNLIAALSSFIPTTELGFKSDPLKLKMVLNCVMMEGKGNLKAKAILVLDKVALNGQWGKKDLWRLEGLMFNTWAETTDVFEHR